MATTKKRQLSKDKEEVYTNTFQNLSLFPSAEAIKCPVNIGDSRIGYKLFRLYCKYLDLKAQNPNVGTFRTYYDHRHYQRTIKQLIAKGWATKAKPKTVQLKAYQYVWRDMGIQRVSRNGVTCYKYWKIPTNIFADDRKTYLRQIEDEIRKRMAQRKRAQIRHALKKGDHSQATFAARSASLLFGFRSPSTGSKLRKTYFAVIDYQTPEEAKPYFNKVNGRYENRTKQIAI
jgi:hypothetical protein